MADTDQIELNGVDHAVDTDAIPAELAWQYRAVPMRNGGEIQFWIDENQREGQTRSALEIQLGASIDFEFHPSQVIQRLLESHFPRTLGADRALQELQDSADVLEVLVLEARKLRSSDIHIERYEHQCRVRFRIDGVLIPRYSISPDLYPALINRIKIRSNLDIAEKRLPQDGRIEFESYQERFDIRVSITPAHYGEKAVLRLLNRDGSQVDLSTIGLSGDELEVYKRGIRKPSGIILISGPTGSGKTTTLYATLKHLNNSERNIMTIEEPVEYTLEGVNQVQVKEKIGLTFAHALRSFLRQDPDVIMLGEIRDEETAEMAIRASMTGHLVLSTIHTNSAWGTIARLRDMGIPPFLLAQTVNTCVAQRLVRKLCEECKASKYTQPGDFPPEFNIPEDLSQVCVPIGCDSCYHSGYNGRLAIYEIISIDHELKQKIKSGEDPSSEELKTRDFGTLSHNALSLLSRGETSIQEVYSLLQ